MMNMNILRSETNQTARAAQEASMLLQRSAIPSMLRGITGLTKPAPKDKQ